jgi:hypothetical protein
MKKPSPRETGTTRDESGASPGAIYRMHRFKGRGARLVRIARCRHGTPVRVSPERLPTSGSFPTGVIASATLVLIIVILN